MLSFGLVRLSKANHASVTYERDADRTQIDQQNFIKVDVLLKEQGIGSA